MADNAQFSNNKFKKSHLYLGNEKGGRNLVLDRSLNTFA
jgi:hypothetical protein